jgi:hydrogenase expression/formation protein HypC
VTLTPHARGDHAGLSDACAVGEEGCITCGDVALPLRVQRVDLERMLALCANDEGQTETVEVALVGEVAAGDELLVHAGTAIAHLGSPEVAA